jgi:hypothetical protein
VYTAYRISVYSNSYFVVPYFVSYGICVTLKRANSNRWQDANVYAFVLFLVWLGAKYVFISCGCLDRLKSRKTKQKEKLLASILNKKVI